MTQAPAGPVRPPAPIAADIGTAAATALGTASACPFLIRRPPTMVDHSPPLAETASCRCARQPCPPDQIDAAVRTAAVYGARRPTLASRPETFGLALLLLINRNDEPARRIVRDARCIAERIVVDQALCVPAEDFAAALTGKESCAGWRGGAV